MMSNGVSIRFARPEDAAALVDIYAPYVLETAITFEYEVPSPEEFRARMENIQRRYPYLVAERDGAIAGYAYAGGFVGRAAYDWSVETTIYLRRDARGRGLGRALYEALEAALREMGVTNLNACIGYPAEEDARLTKNSAEFHGHLGYAMVGEFHKCGYKFGRWYNMAWMEKLIGEHPAAPAAVKNVNDIKSLLREAHQIG